MWVILLIGAIIIGAILGAVSSDKGEAGAGAVAGAVTGGVGCGLVLVRLFLWGMGIMLVIWLFSAIFG